jgi:voltage-gated potassium channel
VSARERLRQILVSLVGVIALGTVGYQLIERWGFFDSLYMTVVTIASVSFDSVHPLTRAGRWFTIGLIVVGRAIVLYAIGALTAFWVEGDIAHLWEKRRMERRIAALRDHIVVCGGGEMGRHVARELLRTRRPFVCIEIDPAKEEALRKLGDGMLYIIGDATTSDVLQRARAEAARGLIACMPSDKDNLFASTPPRSGCSRSATC